MESISHGDLNSCFKVVVGLNLRKGINVDAAFEEKVIKDEEER